MIETFVALLLAHVLADYVLQPRWMVDHKSAPGAFLLHGLAVLVTAGLVLGSWDAWEIAVLAGLHMVIDAVKTFGRWDGIGAHLLDQIAHLITLGAVALFAPGLYAGGLWADLGPALPHAFALLAGAVLVTRAGGFAVGILMRDYQHPGLPEGLTNGGMMIGLLERGLIFLFVLVGQPAGVGFLIAAKSVLRFDSTRDRDHGVAEYVIIGTLASFGWAILISYGVVALRGALPPPALP